MEFKQTSLAGAFVIELEPIRDARGSFTRAFCTAEFTAQGIDPRVAEGNLSHNHLRGTLRGMHYQIGPRPSSKLVRCIRGRVFDVMVDIRKGSPTFGDHIGVELSASNQRMVYAPAGFAHGYLTLEDDCLVYYQSNELYVPELSRGFRWNDPRFAIDWPMEPEVLKDRDRHYPDFTP